MDKTFYDMFEYLEARMSCEEDEIKMAGLKEAFNDENPEERIPLPPVAWQIFISWWT